MIDFLNENILLIICGFIWLAAIVVILFNRDKNDNFKI